MKKFNLISVIAVILVAGFHLQTLAQSKSDLVECMKKVLAVNDSRPFFQFDAPKPNTAIFLKEKELMDYDIRNEDFKDYKKNVRIWGKEDLFMRAIRENKYLCRIKFDGSASEMNILITAFIQKDNDAFYQAVFVLNKEGQIWKITSQNFNKN